ncbi:glycosyltransferase [Candidatus Vampirococcus lugosii]|uniref:Glycosyl transferase n=1 Tax=Candidatus Vampirococcus lugosii TaxID=2789015 RepID=A0ABS5QJU0_9BACT|nr:glycosyltransferase [Candidatus Vampirococcus lugosii]MBS8121530.1 Glycosyl transferase [Candidatus Vampirococcus lugosii]
MKKKKLLFVITGFKKGGAERQMLNLLNGIKNDFEIQVVGFFDGYYKKEIENLGIKVHLIKLKSNLGIFKAVYKVNKITKNFKPDTIQSMLPHANIVCKLVNAINFNKYTIFTGIRNSREPKLLEILEKITDRSSNKIITNSITNKNALIKRGFEDNKIQVIYNGINFQEPKEKYHYDKKTILTVGKFYPQKDYETNVLVVEKLSQKRGDFQFLYAGVGPEKEKIANLVKEKNLDNFIKFLGVRDDIPELMNSADLFFLPTKFEGQANVILEAMYYNLPILTTDIPENTEVCEALFGEVGDINFFAEKINEFLDNKIDFKEKIIINKESIQNFTVDKMVNEYLKFYK